MLDPGWKCRVVIIDDDGDIRALLRLFLERAGDFEVVGEGGNGREGVEVASAVAPDQVLLDISMPVLDGLQALPLIKAALPEANIVMLTGLDDPDVRGHAFAAGADASVPKRVISTARYRGNARVQWERASSELDEVAARWLPSGAHL